MFGEVSVRLTSMNQCVLMLTEYASRKVNTDGYSLVSPPKVFCFSNPLSVSAFSPHGVDFTASCSLPVFEQFP